MPDVELFVKWITDYVFFLLDFFPSTLWFAVCSFIFITACIPLHEYITFYLSILLLIDVWGFFLVFFLTNLASDNIYSIEKKKYSTSEFSDAVCIWGDLLKLPKIEKQDDLQNITECTLNFVCFICNNSYS